MKVNLLLLKNIEVVLVVLYLVVFAWPEAAQKQSTAEA
jgi:hypothetical protein